MSTVRIGVISDTHMTGSVRELWPEVAEAFADVELILHGGDITNLSVLDQLGEIAPVRASRGNNDPGLVDPRLDEAQWLTIDGLEIGMVHDDQLTDEHAREYGLPPPPRRPKEQPAACSPGP